jgi:hypothetical protein
MRNRNPLATMSEWQVKISGKKGLFQNGMEGEAARTKPGYSVTKRAQTAAMTPMVLLTVSLSDASQEVASKPRAL